MRVIVTGAAGFLGSHLTDALIQDGHSILGVDNLSTGSLDNLAHLTHESRFAFEERDTTQQFDPGRVDYVFNFASPASPGRLHAAGIGDAAGRLCRELPAFALRLALTGHVDIPREGEIDHLIESEKLFNPAQPKTAAKKTSSKPSGVLLSTADPFPSGLR